MVTWITPSSGWLASIAISISVRRYFMWTGEGGALGPFPNYVTDMGWDTAWLIVLLYVRTGKGHWVMH